jgi:CBS domain-containing protein
MATIESVMAREPGCCTPDDGVVDCAQRMERDNVGMVPVVESLDTRKLIGVVTDRDLCLEVLAHGLDPNDVTVEECMSDELYTIGLGDSLARAAELMEMHQVRRLPVVDEHGAILGVLSLGDVARAIGSQTFGSFVRDL